MCGGQDDRMMVGHGNCARFLRVSVTVALLGLCFCLSVITRLVALEPKADQCLLLTEVMVNPTNIDDRNGEWLELTNICDRRVNIKGLRVKVWRNGDDVCADTIETRLLVEPGQHLVIARDGDRSRNGHVRVDYQWSHVFLPDQRGELQILRENVVIDSVSWERDSLQTAPEGASLERQGTSRAAPWAPAVSAWPRSQGNLGSPGQAFTGIPPDRDTPTPVPTATQILSPTPSSTSTSNPRPTPPTVYISEIMANPAAVYDNVGEWFELFNSGQSAVNLRDWRIMDLDSDYHVVAADLWIEPGNYVVVGRIGDRQQNGGAPVSYVYSGIDLANERDELVLVAPSGIEADRLVWGDPPLRIREGSSLERIGFGETTEWVTAASQWPSSAGDRGSPGTAYVALPTATATPTLASVWSVAGSASSLVIDEVYVDGTEHEYIVLANIGEAALSLSDWSIGDAEFPGDGEALYALPAGVMVSPGVVYIIARDADSFAGRWGFLPDAELANGRGDVISLERRTRWSSGSFALNDDGDEIVLLNPAMEIADALAYGQGRYSAVGLSGEFWIPDNFSAQRVPGYQYPNVADTRYRYLTAPPNPSEMRTLPAGRPRTPVMLDDGLVAVWGVLGARSNFSDAESAPPHYLSAAASANGLDFLAIADNGRIHHDVLLQNGSTVVLPAWRWVNGEGAEAVIYGGQPTALHTWSDLREYLDTNGYVAQAQVDEPPSFCKLKSIHADDASLDNVAHLYERWRSTRQPLLPAGNARPPYEGGDAGVPRYTGLAVQRVDEGGILSAIDARRGWLSSTSGLALTMRIEGGPWMGNVVDAEGDLGIRVEYSDRENEAAGLALWENNHPIRKFDSAGGVAAWTVRVPATPGAILYAVATQRDGDFAVTAPIIIANRGDDADSRPDTSDDDDGDASPVHGEDDDDRDREPIVMAHIEQGQAAGPTGSLALAKLQGLDARVQFRAQVVAPPGLFNAAIYVAEPAGAGNDIAGLGTQVYLRNGVFGDMTEGDWVEVRGQLHSFRGELEVLAEQPEQVWRIEDGTPLQPLLIRAYEVGETLEGRLVTFTGTVCGWQGDSIYLCDPERPEVETRVTVRSSLSWKRPYVNEGEVWKVTGIVSQFAKEHPWNGGYRVLVRYEENLLKLE